MLRDRYGRKIDYLRLSVTDRCNLRCAYCAPPPAGILPRGEILSYEELHRVVAVCAAAGIIKVRLTGGEPLMRRGLAGFARGLSRIAGLEVLALTSNGTMLRSAARELAEAGVSRVNISLDTLDAAQYRRITRTDLLGRALDGIDAALEAGFERVKINAVIIRGFNEDQIVPLAGLAAEKPVELRFIECMPIAGLPGEGLPVSAAEVEAALRGGFRLERLPGGDGALSSRYAIAGGRGSVGFISPISASFCHNCNRLRLTADGQLRPCLLGDGEVDIRAALRDGADDAALLRLVEQAVANKQPGHAIGRGGAGYGEIGCGGMRRIGG